MSRADGEVAAGVEGLGEARVRRAPHLTAHWGPHGMELAALASSSRWLVRERHLRLLARADDWTAPAALLDGADPDERAGLARDLSWLLERSLLVREGETDLEVQRAVDSWGRWVPDAARFHLATKDVTFVNPDDWPEEIVTSGPPPPPTKSWPEGAPRLELPAFPREGALARVLRARRTWRCFDPAGSVTLDQAAALLGLTWAVQRWAHFPGVPPQALKTSPSGGARHSIEAYVAIRDVEGVESGLYHYGPDTHALTRVQAGLTREQVADFLPAQPAYEVASLVVFQTSVFERVQWRYKHPRAYRNVLIEAGHLAQVFCLVATDLGLAPFCTAALSERSVERALGLDGVRESLVYAVGVGPRPAVEWAPVPFFAREGTRSLPAYASRLGWTERP